VLNLPEHLVPECVIAVGRRADASTLPDDLREREQPSDRKPLAEMLSAGAVRCRNRLKRSNPAKAPQLTLWSFLTELPH
jgi:hypothetical protein